HPNSDWRRVKPVHRQRRLRVRQRCRQPAVRRRLRGRAARRDGRLPRARAPARRVRGALAVESRATRIGLGIWVALVLAFLYLPLLAICLYAFYSSNLTSL